MTRACGSCTLCCSLVPVPEIKKPANQRCQHQTRSRGCKVYRREGFPLSCRVWSCRWLTDPAAGDLLRPDRSGYVIDMASEFVEVGDNATQRRWKLPVVQIWCDPKRPDAHRDPRLREYLTHLAKGGTAALVRYSAQDGFVLLAPRFTGSGWQEMRSECGSVAHTAAEIADAVGRKSFLNTIDKIAPEDAREFMQALTAMVMARLQTQGRVIAECSVEELTHLAREAAAELKHTLEAK